MIHAIAKNLRQIFEDEDLFVDKDTFLMQDDLHPDFWEDGKLKEAIRLRLITIAQDFFDKIGVDAEVKDITFTGSLANFNWSNFSDIDLHIIADFKEVGDNIELVKEMFDAKRFMWNKTHDIHINDFEVEIYVQDEAEPHESSGVYSVLNNEWLTEPTPREANIDWENVTKKALSLMDRIDRIQSVFDKGEYQDAYDHTLKMKEKIRKFRSSGLQREGEFSPENIAFKVLRRNGYLEKLSTLRTVAYDKKMSIKKDAPITINVESMVKGWKGYLVEDKEITSYIAYVRLALNKQNNITRGEAQSEIRAIPGVTTVNLMPDPKSEGEVYYYATFGIKFCCEPSALESPSFYVKKVLIPGMKRISGVTVVRIIGVPEEDTTA